MILLTTLNSKYIHTSLALFSLQAYCRREFDQIVVEEFNINQDLGWILGEIYKCHPQVLGISTNIWNILPSLELVEWVKKILPEAIIILGGPEAAADAAGILRRAEAPDYIIIGEGEATLLELLRNLRTGEGNPAEIKGLAFMDGEELVFTPPRPPLALESIPFPYDNLSAFRNRLVYYESSRGCPFNCAYCLSGWEKSQIRYLPTERVKKDLVKFIEAGIPTVKLIDRTFNIHRQRALEIMEFIATQEGNTEFHLEMVGELMDEEMISLLNQAPRGRFRVEIGVQSTYEPALSAVNRRYNLERLKTNCLALTKEKRVTVHLDLIAGLPFEGLDSFSRSFDWTYRLKPDELQVGFLKLLKGSPLRDKAEEYGYLYTETPPYEILQNKWLSYQELLHLKMVEEMVGKFFNSGHFHHTLAFVLKDEEVSPWEFFSTLAQYWEKNDLAQRGLKQSVLFNQLWNFLELTITKWALTGEKEQLRDLLTFDYYLSGAGGAAPAWLSPQSKLWREAIKAQLKEAGQPQHIFLQQGLKVKSSELRRRMILLNLSINPETGEKGSFPVLIYPPAQGRPSWFKLPLSITQIQRATGEKK